MSSSIQLIKNKERALNMKQQEDGLLETTKATENDCTIRGTTENANSHQIDEGMQPNCPMPATEDQNSFGGEMHMMVSANKATYSETNNKQYLDHQEEEIQKAKLKVNFELGSSGVLLGLSELLSIMFLPENSVSKQTHTTIAILGFLALLCGFCLQMHTLFLLAPSNTCTHPIHNTISKCLFIISCTSLVLVSLPLSLLPKPYNLLISIVLVAILLTLVAHLYLRFKTIDAKNEKDQTEYSEQMKEITRLSELSQVVISLSSGGLIGLLFGIHKNASSHAHHPAVSAIAFLTFTSFIFSTFLMFLCQMRLVHLSSRARKHFLGIGEVFCKFLLVLLALAALVIAFEFLKVYTVMVSIPVLIVYIMWQSFNIFNIDHFNTNDNFREEELKLAYTKANKVTSISFGGITAIFSGYLGSGETNMHLNICMIFMASAFISGLCLMLLSYKPSTGPHIGSVVIILSYFAVNLLAFGGLAIFILEFVGYMAPNIEEVMRMMSKEVLNITNAIERMKL